MTAVLVGSLARDGEGADSSAFRIAGSVRLREEVLDEQFRPGYNENQSLFSMRSTLLAEWQQGNWRLGAEMYDSRAYGADPGDLLSTGEVNAFEIVQAYAVRSFADAFGQGTSTSVQAGRFTMNVGSRRLVAADDYRNTTNGYTGIRTDFTLRNKTAITAYYTLPQERRPDDPESLQNNKVHFDHESFDLQLWGLLVAQPDLPGRLTAEAGYVGFKEADEPGRPTRNRNLTSFSGRLITEPAPGQFDYETEAIVQTGRIRASLATNAALQDVSTWFVHAMPAGHSMPWASHGCHLSTTTPPVTTAAPRTAGSIRCSAVAARIWRHRAFMRCLDAPTYSPWGCAWRLPRHSGWMASGYSGPSGPLRPLTSSRLLACATPRAHPGGLAATRPTHAFVTG